MKFFKFFSNFATKKQDNSGVIQKCENIFKSNKNSTEVHSYRTLVDIDNHPEDIFRHLEKSYSSIPKQSDSDNNK